MPHFLFKFLIKNKLIRNYLLERLVDKYKSAITATTDPVYVSKLLQYVDCGTIATGYSPLKQGNLELLLHSRNAVEFLKYCSSTTEAISNDNDIVSMKKPLKSTTLDDWLVDDGNVPIKINSLNENLMPAIQGLCRVLIAHSRHQSAGYYQRQSSKVLHDAKCLLETLTEITN